MSGPEDARPSSEIGGESTCSAAEVEARVQERLIQCPYSYYFNKVTWRYTNGTLILKGCVATFYLKQMLQTMLRDIMHVQRLLKEVNVVNASGLSSEIRQDH